MRKFRFSLRDAAEAAVFAAVAFFSFPIIIAIVKVMFMG